MVIIGVKRLNYVRFLRRVALSRGDSIHGTNSSEDIELSVAQTESIGQPLRQRVSDIVTETQEVEGNESESRPIEMGMTSLSDDLEKKCPTLGCIKEFMRIFFLILFLYGNLEMIRTHSLCLGDYPELEFIIYTYLALGYLYVGLPIFLGIIVCFCLPCILIFFVCYNGETRRGVSRKDLNKIKGEKFTLECTSGVTECPICLGNYVEEDLVCSLKCNLK